MNPVKLTSRAKWIIAILSFASLVLLILLMGWLRPGVPKNVTILSGIQGSRSYAWAQRYADFVEQHGVGAKVITTAGSGEILERFQQTKAPMVGFLQSGVERTIAHGKVPESLRSLGSLYYEPVWLIAREGSGIGDIPDLQGKRVFGGGPDSDTRAAVLTLLEAYGVDPPQQDPELGQLTQDEVVDALLSGRLDAAFFASASTAEAVRRLLGEEGVYPVSAKHADVFERTHPDLGNLFIPEGLFDLGEMIPRQDVRVMAPAINLVADESLHPALVDLFLDAATSLHRSATLLSKRGEFPSEDYTSLPMSEEAIHYYEKGPGGFRKYLPFWVASLIDQLIIYGLPIFVVLSTVFKGIPVYLEWKIKLDLLGFYKRLAAIEKAPSHELEKCLAELAAIEAESSKLHVPGLHLPAYFEFRQSIHDMRERLERGW